MTADAERELEKQRAEGERALGDARRQCFQEVDRARREAQYLVETTRRAAEEEGSRLTNAREKAERGRAWHMLLATLSKAV